MVTRLYDIGEQANIIFNIQKWTLEDKMPVAYTEIYKCAQNVTIIADKRYNDGTPDIQC